MRGIPVKLTLDRSDLGVAVDDGKASTWSSIVAVTVPAGFAYVLLNDTPFVFKLYDTTPAVLARAGKIIVGYKGAGDTLVKELYRWDYGVFYDLTVAQQKDKEYLDSVSVHMSWPYVIAREDEQLLIQLYHTTACDISEVGNVVEFKVQRVIVA